MQDDTRADTDLPGDHRGNTSRAKQMNDLCRSLSQNHHPIHLIEGENISKEKGIRRSWRRIGNLTYTQESNHSFPLEMERGADLTQ